MFPRARPPIACLLFVGIALAHLGTGGSLRAAEEERSPFEMVRFVDDDIHVMVKRRWYVLIEVGGVSVTSLRHAATRLDAKRPEKRICEDLLAVFATIDRKLGATTTLIVRALGAHRRTRLGDVPVTAENRERLLAARPWREPERIERHHEPRAYPTFAWLQIRHHEASKEPRLRAEHCHADLDQLEWLVEHRAAYRDLRSFDWRAAFDTVRVGIGRTGIAPKDFHLQLRKLVSLFGDGHASVPGLSALLPAGGLPFALRAVGKRVAAVDRKGRLYDDDFPFIRSIDGRRIDAWIEAGARVAPYGSPQMRRYFGLRHGCSATFVRGELKLPTKGPLKVSLYSETGKRRALKLDVAERARPFYPRYRSSARLLDDDIAYVPIRRMYGRGKELRDLLSTLESMQNARGLILDIRENPGGQRETLMALMPHFMPAGVAPVVVNIGARRMPPDSTFHRREGELGDRGMYPQDWHGFTRAERGAAEQAISRFRPDWPLDEGEFSPWHAMLISPLRAGAWRYTGRIAVLIDAGAFSAADVFAGALELLPKVTLIGTATSGGSGRKLEYVLRHSGLLVTLSSMASFRPGGERFDGRGVEPDLHVEPSLEDIREERDPVLERAVRGLTR